MKTATENMFVTPVKKAVAKAISNPLGVISAALLILSWLMLTALDFNKGLILLPAIIFNLVADLVKICKAKKLKGDFGLKFSLFSSVLGLLISAAFFILLIIDLSYLQAFLNGALSQLSFKSTFPFYHINTGFLNVEGMLLALILFFLSKAIYSRSLAKTLRRNVPKSLALWVCAVLQLLTFIVFIQDGLDRMQIIPSHYKYCGTEANNLFIMYYSSVVCLIATVAVLLLFIKTFITIHKMRKIRNAF